MHPFDPFPATNDITVFELLEHIGMSAGHFRSASSVIKMSALEFRIPQ